MITVERKDVNDITLKCSFFHEDGIDHTVLISEDNGQTFDNKGIFDGNQLSTGVDIPCPAGNIQVKIETNKDAQSEQTSLTKHVV